MAAKEFDYASAWADLAVPGWHALTPEVKALVVRTADESKDRKQLPDLSMPWPEDTGLLEAFAAIPRTDLAIASHVVYFLGHWYPGRSEGAEQPVDLPAGASWKFSAYADQSLRQRFGLPNDNRHGNGTHLEIHQGLIRVCYSSRDMWIWTEIAEATPGGMARAEIAKAKIDAAIAGLKGSSRDDAASDTIESLRRQTPDDLPEVFRPWVNVSDRYMVERMAKPITPANMAKQRQRVIDKYENALRRVQNEGARERNGLLWLIDRGIPIENCIYYCHKNTFSFGWREPVSNEFKSRLLDVLVEFPYAYEIKVEGGGRIATLEAC